MNRYDCDTIRDLLPAFVRGELLPHETASAEAHLQTCGECREERSLVALMQDVLVPVPSGLEARVVMALRAKPVFAPRRFTPVRLAMAATIAAAVIGGTVMFDRARHDDALNADADAAALSWAARENPLLHGSSHLEELSVEELEILLSELGS